MNRLRTIRRRMTLLATAAGWWLAGQAAALAQAKPDEAPASGGRNLYLASYFVVLLGILLGMLFVCNPARRRDRAKPESYGE